MSEVHQPPPYSTPRGSRGSSRGGRGGARGGGPVRGPARNSNGDISTSYSSAEDQGEVGQLKKKYAHHLGRLEEMFPDWTSENLVLALEENNGDLHNTAAKITEGFASQPKWDEVKKKTRPKTQANNDSGRGVRGARGNFDGARPGRGRGGATPEPRGGHIARARGTNGVARPSKDFTEESPTGETALEAEIESVEESKKKVESGGASPPAPAVNSQSGAVTWASLLKPVPPPPAPVQKKAPLPKQAPSQPAPEPQAPLEPKGLESATEVLPLSQEPIAELSAEPSSPQAEVPIATPAAELELEPEAKPEASVSPATPATPAVPVNPVIPAIPAIPTVPAIPAIPAVPAVPAVPATSVIPAVPATSVISSTQATPVTPVTPVASATLVVPEAPIPLEVKEAIPSPQQPLTEVNLEKIEDVAPPAPTTTQASTIASPAPTPSAVSSIAPPPVQPMATTPRTAYAGVAMPKMTPRMRHKVLVQQEAVIMPSSHNAVEHATLQFGSMGLNGDLDDDDEIEQAETVSQPPQPSPIAQPVTALPPTGPTQLSVSQPPVTETLSTTRQAPGLPTHPQVTPQQPTSQPPLAPQSMTQQHLNQHIPNQYNRYGIPDSQQPQAKSFDTFGQQQSAPQPQAQPQQPQPPQSQPQNYAGYGPSQLQPHQQPSHIGVGVSTTPDQQHQYNNYYDRAQPPGFGNLYNSSYMQQGQSQQDAGANQQRSSSGLGGAGETLGQVPTSAPTPGQVQQPTSRYGTAQTGEQSSGHGTPSPAIAAAQQTSQPHQPGLAQYPGGMPAYGYQHPYYNQFMHQSYYNHPSPFGKHQGMYGYPQAYMSPQYSDHSSTPAGLGGFGTPSTQGRESVGLGDYGRMNATASQQQQQSLPQHSSAGAYGNSNNIPNFLNSRGLPEQQQQQLGSGVGQQQVAQQAQNDDSMKFGENKPPTGPSSTPLIPGQPGRPGSATSGANIGPQHGAQTPASMYGAHNLHGHQGQQSQYGVGQGQSATSQYSMYPQYGGQSNRYANAGWGGGGYGH